MNKPELILPGSAEYDVAVEHVVPKGALAKGPRNLPKPSERKRRRSEVRESRRRNRS